MTMNNDPLIDVLKGNNKKQGWEAMSDEDKDSVISCLQQPAYATSEKIPRTEKKQGWEAMSDKGKDSVISSLTKPSYTTSEKTSRIEKKKDIRKIIMGSVWVAIVSCFAIPLLIAVLTTHVHDIDERVIKTATSCSTEDGIIEYFCTKSNCDYVEQKPYSLEHDYVESITKQASCTQEGEKTYSCKRCGDAYTRTINASHTMVDGVCTVCGKRPSNIEADTTYKGNDGRTVFYFYCMNADVPSWGSAANWDGAYNLISYYPVCRKCHMTGSIDMLTIKAGESKTISYYCPDCGESTAVKFEFPVQ